MQQAGAIRAGRAFVEVGANTDALASGLRAAQARIAAFGSAVKGLGAGLMGLGMGALVPFAGAAKTFMDFEAEMARVKSIIEPTTADFEALNKEALRIGRETVFSSSEAARAMVYFAQAGFSVKEMLQATGPAMKLASSNAIGLEQATGAAITVLRGMGLSASDLTRSLNVLGAAAIASYTDVTLLASGFSYAAADARSAGMDIESVAAALAVFSDEGVRGERAGTTLRAILADFKNLTPQAAAELQRLRVKLNDEKGNWRPIADIFADLGAKLNTMGNYARDNSLSKIFDTRSGSGATILMQNLEKFVRLTSQVRKSGGLLDRMESTQLDTLRGSWKLLTSAIEGLVLEVGKSLAPVLRDAAGIVVEVSNAAAAWAKENPELFQTILKVAAGVTVAGGAMMAMGIVIGSIAPLIGVVTTGLAAVGGAIAVLAKPLAIMGAIAGAFAMLASYTEAGKSAWEGLASFASSVMGWAYSGLVKTFAQVGDSARLAMTGIWDAIQGSDLDRAFKIAALGVQAIFEDLWANMKAGGLNVFSYLSGSFIKAFITAGEAVANVMITIFQFLKDVWARTWGAIQGTWDHTAIQRSREEVEKNAEWAAKKRAGVAKNATDWREAVDVGTAADVARRNAEAGKASAGTREKIAELNAAALQKREVAETMARLKDMGPKLPDDLLDRAKPLGEGGLVPGKGEVSGTFNAAMAGMMGASSVNQQIAEATKRTADATERLAKKEGGVYS